MKKLIAMLLALTMVFALAACGGSATEETKAPEVAAPAETQAAATGSVYYLNFKPEADAAWQELAATYTAQTGVEVKVVTAASGTYSDTLTAEMAKTEAPTLFQCGNAWGVEDWGDYCLDLTGTKVVGELTTDAFNLYDDAGALKAMGYCYEAYGIIVNVDLLETAGYTLADITDFASLKAVADDIHARSAELGFDAFSAPGLDGSSSWRFSGHLANAALYYEWAEEGYTASPATIKGSSMDLFKNIWDLYITDTAADPTSLTTGTGDQSKAEFTEGKAVFYQNGSWEYNSLAVENGMNVAMIPIYMGAEGETNAGLCSGTENCWAVNAKADQADIDATLEFLYWVVTSEEGTTMMAEQLGVIPFKNAKENTNGFMLTAEQDIAEGKYAINWSAMNSTPNIDSWRATVVTALATYSADPSDANWAAVEEAFVDGWAYEYSIVKG